jgi:predicted permease
MLVARWTNTPRHHVQTVLVACAFGNSTGLPITLLTVVHANFPVTSNLGRVDPTLFLSVYLLLFPVLQWGLGGYLLASAPAAAAAEDPIRSRSNRRGNSLRHNVLNYPIKTSKRRGLTSTDEGLYMTEGDLTKLVPAGPSEPSRLNAIDLSLRSEEQQLLLSHSAADDDDDTGYGVYNNNGYDNEDPHDESTNADDSRRHGYDDEKECPVASIAPIGDIDTDDDDSIWQTISNVLDRCLQPPVVGAVLGIICAVLPRVRGVLVDLVDRDSTAPLQFLFDGLYAIGQTAVPLNMYVKAV